MKTGLALSVALALSCAAQPGGRPGPAEPGQPKHFISFGLERNRTSDPRFLSIPSIVGAQLKYTWKELEPERDRYELGAIRRDLTFLDAHGKRLFVQLQDLSFDEAIVNVPDYLLEDPAFGGGVARKYEFERVASSIPRASATMPTTRGSRT